MALPLIEVSVHIGQRRAFNAHLSYLGHFSLVPGGCKQSENNRVPTLSVAVLACTRLACCHE